MGVPRAFARSGLAPLAGPTRPKAPWNTLLKVAIFHAEIFASYGVSLHPNLGVVPRHASLGPCTVVRAKLTNSN